MVSDFINSDAQCVGGLVQDGGDHVLPISPRKRLPCSFSPAAQVIQESLQQSLRAPQLLDMSLLGLGILEHMSSLSAI